jgi:hypothetical protein
VGRSSAAFRLVSSVVEMDRAGVPAEGESTIHTVGTSGSIMVLLRNYWPDMYGRAAADGGKLSNYGDAQRVLPLPARTHLPYAVDVRVITKHRRQTNAESVGSNSHSPLIPVHQDPF